MKKLLLLVLSVLILVIIALVCREWLYYRIYPFDRFTCMYSVELDGNKVKPKDIYYKYEGNYQKNFDVNSDTFKIKGGSYGAYGIYFVFDNEALYNITGDIYFKECDDVEFLVKYMNSNSWHITDMDIKMDFVNENDSWFIMCIIDVDESGDRYSVSEKISIDEMGEKYVFFGI